MQKVAVTSPSTIMSTILGGTIISSTNFASFDSATCGRAQTMIMASGIKENWTKWEKQEFKGKNSQELIDASF